MGKKTEDMTYVLVNNYHSSLKITLYLYLLMGKCLYKSFIMMFTLKYMQCLLKYIILLTNTKLQAVHINGILLSWHIAVNVTHRTVPSFDEIEYLSELNPWQNKSFITSQIYYTLFKALRTFSALSRRQVGSLNRSAWVNVALSGVLGNFQYHRLCYDHSHDDDVRRINWDDLLTFCPLWCRR